MGTTRVAPFSSVKSVRAHIVLQTSGTCGRGNGMSMSSACKGCGVSPGPIAIDESDELDLASILGRLTVDGRDELQESSAQVLDNDADPLVGTYLTKDLIIISVGSAIPLPGAAGKFYYQADFVPILVERRPAGDRAR